MDQSTDRTSPAELAHDLRDLILDRSIPNEVKAGALRSYAMTLKRTGYELAQLLQIKHATWRKWVSGVSHFKWGEETKLIMNDPDFFLPLFRDRDEVKLPSVNQVASRFLNQVATRFHSPPTAETAIAGPISLQLSVALPQDGASATVLTELLELLAPVLTDPRWKAEFRFTHAPDAR